MQMWCRSPLLYPPLVLHGKNAILYYIDLVITCNVLKIVICFMSSLWRNKIPRSGCEGQGKGTFRTTSHILLSQRAKFARLLGCFNYCICVFFKVM